MANAGVIYINENIDNQWDTIPIAIQTDMFSDLWYNSNGIITRFSVNNDGNEVEEYIIKKYQYSRDKRRHFTYYFNKNDYRKYLASKKKDFLNIRRFDSNNFIRAKKGDTIKIYRRELSLEENSTCCRQVIYWQYDGNIIELSPTSGAVQLPDTHTLGSRNCNVLDVGQDFFDIHSLRLYKEEITVSSLMPLNNPEEKTKCHSKIANIANLIKRIDKDIFKAYESENPSLQFSLDLFLESLSNITEAQKDNFKSSYRYTLNNLNDFNSYYLNLHKYYNLTQNKFLIIEQGNDLKKATNLLLGLHSNLLVKISVEKRLEIIKYLIDNELETASEEFWNTVGRVIEHDIDGLIFQPDISPDSPLVRQAMVQQYEKLVIKLCLAFNEPYLEVHSNGDSHIDVFLQGLLGFYDKTEEVTIYQALYDRMSTSWNITESFIHLGNWVFDTDFKPDNTRAAFVQAVYALWVSSKFNPYDDEGNLKSNTIGIKILENGADSLAYFSNEHTPKNQSCLFYYTNETAYDRIDLLQENNIYIYRYILKWDNAAPIVIPYESNKIVGIHLDNFNFKIKKNKIAAYQFSLPAFSSPPSPFFDQGSVGDVLYGTYDIFQPISLLSVSLETKVPILSTTGSAEFNGTKINSLVPAFVLHYVDDVGDRSDVEKILGYIVDGVLTFTGIGNLSRLRHLKLLTRGGSGIGLFTKTGAQIVIGAVEFTSGSLSFLLNFVECLPPSVDETHSSYQDQLNSYEFCEALKGFVSMMEIASGTISAVDNLASLAMKKKAANVINKSGGGSNEIEIKDNLKNKLDELKGSDVTEQGVDEAVEAIAEAGKEGYINYLDVLLKKIDALYRKIHPSLDAITGGPNGWSGKHFRKYFNETNTKIIIHDCLELGISEQKHIHDIILNSCRATKKFTFNETKIMIGYYENVIKKRGFPTGFLNLNDYKLFSKKVKSYLDDYCKQWGINGARYEIQGSVLFKSHLDDPNINNVPILKRDGRIIPPDDLDGRIYISRNEANRFLKKIEPSWRDYYKHKIPPLTNREIEVQFKAKMKEIRKKAEGGRILKTDMPPPDKNGYTKQLRDAVKRSDGSDIFYPKSKKGYSDPGFSIIIKDTPFDIEPVMALKY